jgi:hypothetical protein
MQNNNNNNKRNLFQIENQTSYKNNQPIKKTNHFRQPKINIVNPILTMSFPELKLIQNSSNLKTNQLPEEQQQAYKNTVKIEIECKKSIKEERNGWITLKEGVENIKYQEYQEYQDNDDFIETVIRVQEMLDINHEKYKTQYIELYGESEYNKIYMMTNSHKYYSEDEDKDNDDADLSEEDE